MAIVALEYCSSQMLSLYATPIYFTDSANLTSGKMRLIGRLLKEDSLHP